MGKERGNSRQLETADAAQFLAQMPPGSSRIVHDLVSVPDSSTSFRLNAPRLSLHCTECRGERNFSSRDHGRALRSADEEVFVHYTCNNCGQGKKVYALVVSVNRASADLSAAIKVGEWGPFGPPTSPALHRLIRDDASLYSKGRQAEAEAMGIAALACYRRVIENNYPRFCGFVIYAAQALGANDATLRSLRSAREGVPYSPTGGLPPRLLIAGEDPLVLLQRCRTLGSYSGTDDESLQHAQAARMILSAFADHITEVTANDTALKEAIAHIAGATNESARINDTILFGSASVEPGAGKD